MINCIFAFCLINTWTNENESSIQSWIRTTFQPKSQTRDHQRRDISILCIFSMFDDNLTTLFGWFVIVSCILCNIQTWEFFENFYFVSISYDWVLHFLSFNVQRRLCENSEIPLHIAQYSISLLDCDTDSLKLPTHQRAYRQNTSNRELSVT